MLLRMELVQKATGMPQHICGESRAMLEEIESHIGYVAIKTSPKKSIARVFAKGRLNNSQVDNTSADCHNRELEGNA